MASADVLPLSLGHPQAKHFRANLKSHINYSCVFFKNLP